MKSVGTFTLIYYESKGGDIILLDGEVIHVSHVQNSKDSFSRIVDTMKPRIAEFEETMIQKYPNYSSEKPYSRHAEFEFGAPDEVYPLILKYFERWYAFDKKSFLAKYCQIFDLKLNANIITELI